MRSLVVIQARTSSSRLPAKSLLPLGGIPMAVLAAQRASTKGHRVIVATSTETCDDQLAVTLERASIEVLRGPMSDVGARFEMALGLAPKVKRIVRLTADNVIPDGDFIEALEQAFSAMAPATYMSTIGTFSDLPYGVSAEIFDTRAFLESRCGRLSAQDREHVSPPLARSPGAVRRPLNLATVSRTVSGMGTLRATVDGFDDWLRMDRVFAPIDNPVGVPWQYLCQRLQAESPSVVCQKPAIDMVLGGAQLGMEYGVVSARFGTPAERRSLLESAIDNGVSWVDTASAYGCSEKTIGTLTGSYPGRLRVVTKIDPLAHLPADAPPDWALSAVEASFYRSCQRLRREHLDVLLLHRAVHRTAWQGAVWRRLQELQAEGKIGRLGVSVRTTEELKAALEVREVGHIQLPLNILDYRWEPLLKLAQPRVLSGDLTLHGRSPFLQGLLLQNNQAVWGRAGLSASQVYALETWLDDLVRRFTRRDRTDLCLAYARGVRRLNGIVIGIDNSVQLREVLVRFTEEALTPEQVLYVDLTRPSYLTGQTLDPSRWSPATM